MINQIVTHNLSPVHFHKIPQHQQSNCTSSDSRLILISLDPTHPHITHDIYISSILVIIFSDLGDLYRIDLIHIDQCN